MNVANETAITHGSRNEAILNEILNKLNGVEVGELPPPQSRIEALLLRILDKINEGGGGSLPVHICTSDEYDHSTGVPTISSPDEGTLYLVPASSATTGNLFDEWVYADSKWERVGSVNVTVPVQDVQVNGVSVLDAHGVANVPVANTSTAGVVKTEGGYGILTYGQNGRIYIDKAITDIVKAGANHFRPIVPYNQHESTFYGLAKAAGDSTQSSSSNAVGTYTESAKSAISQMLNGSVTVTGTTPTITALPGIRYVCGEVATLDITLPASGIVDAVFESGSTATVLTITPPTGVTLKWVNGFDPTALEANTTYEINIVDGLGVAASWT